MTVRLGQIMHVNPNYYDEYEKRHSDLPVKFPEMKKALKEAGAHNYSIYLDKKTGTLFAYLEVDDMDKYKAIAEMDACKEWWAYMAPLMDTNPDKSPVTFDLPEVFHLDQEEKIMVKEQEVKSAYEVAKERYAEIGVDTEKSY